MLREDGGLLYRRLVDAEEKNQGRPGGASTNGMRLLKSVHMHLKKRAVYRVQSAVCSLLRPAEQNERQHGGEWEVIEEAGCSTEGNLCMPA